MIFLDSESSEDELCYNKTSPVSENSQSDRVGNYQTFINIPVKENSFIKKNQDKCMKILDYLDQLNTLLGQYSCNNANELLHLSTKDGVDNTSLSRAERQKSPHISVSKPLNLRFHFIEPIVNRLQICFSGLPRFHCEITDQIEILANESHSKFFASLKIREYGNSHKIINDAINRCDQVLSAYGQPQYYSERHLHISLAWINQDLRPIMKLLSHDPDHQVLVRYNTRIWSSTENFFNLKNWNYNIQDKNERDTSMLISKIEIMVGQRITQVNLLKSVSSSPLDSEESFEDID